MKSFENPEISINEFEVEDVVTVSGIDMGDNDFPLIP